MALTIRCPQCQRKLSVPETLLGKRVKCPSCAMAFEACESPSQPAERETAVTPEKGSPAPPAPSPPPPPEASTDYEVVDEPEAKPRPREIVTCPKCKKRYDPGIDVNETLEGMAENISMKVVCPSCGQWLRLPEREPIPAPKASPEILRQMMLQSSLVDDDQAAAAPRRGKQSDDDEEEAKDDRPRPRKKRKRRRSDIRAMLSYPATAFKIVAYVGAGLSILLTLIQGGALLAGGASAPRGPGGGEAYMIGSIVGLVLRIPITLIWSRYIIHVADCMEGLSNYSTVLIGCFVAILPCSLGCFGGIPVAIWALVILCQTDVREAFS